MHGVTMMKADNDNSTWQTLAAATARLLQRYEQQEIDRDGEPDARRSDKKDSSSDGSNITKRRAAAG
jgi:hypothetical protein